jgi:polysaccharide export outer membrane protein
MSRNSVTRAILLIKRPISLRVHCLIVLLPLLISSAEAQLPNSDMLLQLQQSRKSLGSMGGEGQSQQLQSVIIQPAVPLNNRAPLEQSRLEQIISYRSGAKLQQFGYDQLGHGQAVTIPMSGAIQDNYILGLDDEIVVSLRGQENNEFRAIVDRNGQVIIPRLKPISAAGRSLRSFRADLDAAVHRSYVSTNASVSVGRVRQFSVLVSGEVNQPGQRLLTGLSSALDALLLSGGVRKTGSLRNVRILRGGHEFSVDLYSVLTDRGVGSLMPLADGDRILVPRLGPTVSVSGLVRKPGIYELGRNSSSVSVKELMDIAGGPEVRGQHRLSLLREGPDGARNMISLSGRADVVRDGEVLFVQLSADKTNSQVTLSGGTSLAGSYPIQSGTNLSDVLRSPGALGASPYSLFGVVVRRNPKTLLRTLLPYSPVAVINGREDLPLVTDDIIKVFSTNEIQLLEFISQRYLQKLSIDIRKIRNPLTGDDADARDNGAIGLQSPLNSSKSNNNNPNISVIDSNDIGIVPAHAQRNAILNLLDLAAPGTDLARAQAQILRRDLLAQVASPSQGANQIRNPDVDPILYLPDDKFGGEKERLSKNNTPPGMQGGLPNQMIGGNQDTQLNADNLQNSRDEFKNENLAQNYIDQPNRTNGFSYNREANTFGDLSRQLALDPLVLINFVIDHRATINGAVRGAGAFFVGPNVSLDELVQAAGGTVNWANESGVELVSTVVDNASGRAETRRLTLPLKQGLLASYTVRPHDQFHFSRIFSDVGLGSVSMQGEVRMPGSFPIVRGERLSDLLRRAGGLTPTAFPYGTVFTRKSAAQAEREGNLRASKEVNEQLVVAMTRIGNDKIDPSTFTSLQAFVAEMRNQKTLGRISVEADPSLLASQPQIDPLVEDGDVVYIPQRPSTVNVLGQVMQPGSYPYRPGNTLEDYLDKAGGFSSAADANRIFLVLPDGSARRVEKSWLLGFDVDKLPPGSAIVIPRDVTPLNTRQIITDFTQIFSQFAVTAASLAVLSRQ